MEKTGVEQKHQEKDTREIQVKTQEVVTEGMLGQPSKKTIIPNCMIKVLNSMNKDNVSRRKAYNIQDEMKKFEHKIIFLMIIFIILICTIIYVEPYINNLEQRKGVATQQVEKSEFKSILESVISELSIENNQQYALDENYYNEKDIQTYISIMTEHNTGSITKEELKQLFWNIFMPVKRNGIVSLLEKDNETLIMECIDKTKMNMLDHAFMGIVNNEIIKASRGVYISQNNDKFEKIPYGTSNVKNSGCGPISLTMALNYVYGTNVVSLEEVLKWAEENDMYEENSGTKWSLIRNFPNVVSVDCEELYIGTYEKFKESLAAGDVYITIMDKGHFTDNGHFIVVTEIQNEKVSVLDSTSICRSLKKWDAKLVYDESKKYFWRISKRGE